MDQPFTKVHTQFAGSHPHADFDFHVHGGYAFVWVRRLQMYVNASEKLACGSDVLTGKNITSKVIVLCIRGS